MAIVDTLPLISIDRSPAELAAPLGDGFRRFGFAMVTGHGIDADLIARGWAAARAFFALPDRSKRAYLVRGGGGQRGFTAFGTEIAKSARENDLKEFWHIGRDLPPGHPHAGEMPPNIWPDDMADFRVAFTRLFAEFDRVGLHLLSAIALYLGLPVDWFDARAGAGNSVLRLLHYPPVSADAPGIRAAPHEDINLITLLLGAEEGGLELQARDGRWMPIVPPPGALVVNVGDMLQRLTNHVLPSTPHRVVNPPPDRRDRPRFSMPFFVHLAPDVRIEPIAGCVTSDNPARYPPITAADYLRERLSEIGLYGS